jgi:hypothetical protein
MNGFVDTLERDLVEAAARRSAPARRSWRRLLLAGAVLLGIGGTAAVATAVVLRATVIPAPRAVDAGPAQTPIAGSEVVARLRAPDPAGGPPWTLRLARSAPGLVCTTVGQVVDGRFGLVGTDGRFRVLAPGVVDGCSVAPTPATPLMGARTLAARRPADVRTIVNGVAGPTLRAVAVTAAGRPVPVRVGAGGTFVAAVAGYAEDAGVEVRLRFAGGAVVTRRYGVSRWLVRDPLGGPAWRVSAGMLDGHPEECVTFGPVRRDRGLDARSPTVCGRLTDDPRHSGHERGVFVAMRRLDRTARRTADGGVWPAGLDRTAVWGAAGTDVRSLVLLGTPGGSQRLRPLPSRAFLAVLPPSVDPAALRLRVTYADGRTETLRGDANLVPIPGGRP